MLIKILFSIFLLPLYIYGLLLLPSGDKVKWEPFDDHLEDGKSENIALSISDQVKWIFCMKSGCPWPYIGLSLALPRDTLSHNRNSFGKDDSLIIVLRSNRETSVKLQLATYDPLVTKPDNDLTCRVLENFITVKKVSRRVAVPLGEFKTAAWWLARYKVPPENSDLHLESIRRIEWEFTDSDRLDKIDTLIISRVELKHHSSKSHFVYGIIGITFLIGVGVIWKITARKKIPNKTVDKFISPHLLKPKPVLAEAGEWERILSFLQNNYFDAKLNLQKVAAELGFSESRLSRLINEHNPDGFRSLIHDLRIMEAKRLLSETELNISEIAFKLGYAASSHLNREFKQRVGITPSNFRKESSEFEQIAKVE